MGEVKFRLIADATFEAKDVDDAFRLLGKHFHELAYDEDRADKLDFIGEISIESEVAK